MDYNQLQADLIEINKIEEINLESLISEIYIDQQNINDIIISSFKVLEFINLTKRVISQLKNEITDGLRTLLPEQYNFQNEYGNGTLNSLLIAFRGSLDAKTVSGLQSAENSLKTLIYYQIANGFFDKAQRNLHSLRGLNVTETENNLKIMIEHFNSNLKKKKSLFEELENRSKDIDNLINQKKEELKQISLNVETANKDTQNIATLLNNGTATNGKINSIFDQIDKIYEDSLEKVKEENESFANYTAQIEELIQKLNDDKDNFDKQVEKHDKHLEFVETKTQYFEERNKYLDELIGREVGASLFETFKQRKIELSSNIGFWRYAILVSSILLLVALSILFWEMPANAGWEYFAVRSLKTIPLAILLYFTIRQYSKERNFQEEYAFKSACALTIKAYADIIKDEASKDKLILEGVLNVYKSPIYEKEKENKPNKKILEMGVSIAESVKNISKK